MNYSGLHFDTQAKIAVIHVIDTFVIQSRVITHVTRAHARNLAFIAVLLLLEFIGARVFMRSNLVSLAVS